MAAAGLDGPKWPAAGRLTCIVCRPSLQLGSCNDVRGGDSGVARIQVGRRTESSLGAVKLDLWRQGYSC